MSKTIYLSNETQYEATLTVGRDIMNPNRWVLDWSNPIENYRYSVRATDSHVNFRTMKDAIAYGIRNYNEKAIRSPWH